MPPNYLHTLLCTTICIHFCVQKAQSTEVPDNIVTHEYLDKDICDGEISYDPNVRNHDHVANRKNDAIHAADDSETQEIENN